MIKASSLLNTVYVCLIVAVFCGVLIFIAQSNSIIFSSIEESNKLIHQNKYDVSLYFAQYEVESSPFNEKGITTEFKEIPWGFYKVLNSKTYGRSRDTITKSFFFNLRTNSDRNRTALYLKDNGEPLKYSGTVSIDGDLYIPQSKLKPNYITNTKNKLIQNGSNYSSKNSLPRLETTFEFNFYQGNKKIFSIDEVIAMGRLVNSYDSPTIYVNIDREIVLKNLFLKGNIIIYSTAPVTLDATLELTDIILKAPKITVNQDFEGAVQLESEKLIEIKDGARLIFPSGIFVSTRSDSTEVILGKNAILEGMLVVQGEKQKNTKKRSVLIKENGHLLGDLYCKGSLELLGNVTGSVYVNSLSTAIDASTSSNLLLNTKIDAININKIYPRLIFFENTENSIDIIKEL